MQTNVMMVAIERVVLCFSPCGKPRYVVHNVSILIGQLIASPLWLKCTKENSLCLLNFPPKSLSHLSLFLDRLLQTHLSKVLSSSYGAYTCISCCIFSIHYFCIG